jgi:hypothetical protein
MGLWFGAHSLVSETVLMRVAFGVDGVRFGVSTARRLAPPPPAVSSDTGATISVTTATAKVVSSVCLRARNLPRERVQVPSRAGAICGLPAAGAPLTPHQTSLFLADQRSDTTRRRPVRPVASPTSRGAGMKQQPLTANTVTFYHQRSLRKALLQLESALSALGDTDRTLADAGVPEVARVPLSEAQMDVFELQSWIAAELRRSTELAPIEIAVDPATPPAEAATPTAPPPTVQHAMELLFGGTMHADVETEHGQIVTLRLIDQLGARLHASAARLTVVEGMKLTGR